jgi:hypothetical protein
LRPRREGRSNHHDDTEAVSRAIPALQLDERLSELSPEAMRDASTRLSGPRKRFCARCACVLAFVILLATGSRFLARSADQAADGAAAPLPIFTDITAQAGLNMKIVDGDEITEDLIDVNGEGACFLAYNSDGYQDIFLVNGSLRKSEAMGKLPHDYLSRNNGDATFTDVTEQAHLGDSGWHRGCAVGDYNNDGFQDIYLTSFGPNTLYRNNGDGTFTDVAEAAGVADPHWGFSKWSMGAAFGDYDPAEQSTTVELRRVIRT